MKAIFLGVLMTAVINGGAAAQSGCTFSVDGATPRDRVDFFLSSGEYEDVLTQHGMLGLVSAPLHGLTDPQDSSICETLAESIQAPQLRQAPFRWAFYRAGDYYIMVAYRLKQHPDAIELYRAPLVILNAELNTLVDILL